VGGNGSIASNCYATGAVTGGIDVGGFAGINISVITDCYAIGHVAGSSNVGGLAGENTDGGTVQGCYWDTQTTGSSSGYGHSDSAFSGSGLTTAQMKLASSFIGWDFVNVWSVDSSVNNGYPFLGSAIPTSVKEAGPASPQYSSLFQNYPNPFNPVTTIRFALPQRSEATLTVFNTLGQRVAILASGEMAAGAHEVRFDGSRLSSGVYFYTLRVGSFVQTKKLLLMR